MAPTPNCMTCYMESRSSNKRVNTAQHLINYVACATWNTGLTLARLTLHTQDVSSKQTYTTQLTSDTSTQLMPQINKCMRDTNITNIKSAECDSWGSSNNQFEQWLLYNLLFHIIFTVYNNDSSSLKKSTDGKRLQKEQLTSHAYR
jgi:hypothetical protein